MKKELIKIHRSSGMHWVGNGFPVRSVFDYNGLGRELSPFLLLDYAAPHDFPPGGGKRGVGAHPHKGFETVTVAYQGELEHRDSSGGGGKIGAGDVQWMTAGNGILHEEFHSADFTRNGGTLQMVQLWVNLRAEDKSAPAGYQTLLKNDIPEVKFPDEAGTIRIIAGQFGDTRGIARTFTPINLWDLKLSTGKTAELPIPEGHTTALLILSGTVEIGGQTTGEGDLAQLSRHGETVSLHATGDSQILVMSGEPIDEPIVGQGPFVMNSRAEIEEAYAEFQSGAFGDPAEL